MGPTWRVSLRQWSFRMSGSWKVVVPISIHGRACTDMVYPRTRSKPTSGVPRRNSMPERAARRSPYGSLNNGDVRKTGPHIEWCPCKYRLGFVALALKRCRWALPRFWSALPPVGGGMLWVACGRARLFREDCWKSVMPVMCWGIVRFLGRGLRSLRCCAPWWRSVCRLL